MNWKDLTSPEHGKLSRELPIVLPLAATEQHGPHLPVETDTRIAQKLCEATNEHVKKQAIFLPPLAYGCSEHHLCFPGTISLGHETLLHIIEDIAASVFQNNFKNLVLFNAHGGNQAISQVALEKLGGRYPEKLISTVTWWKLAPEELRDLTVTGLGGVGHACEFETSLMLEIEHSAVHQDKIPEKGNKSTYKWAEGDMLRGPKVSLYRNSQAMTSDGSYGEPAAASREKGSQIIDCIAQRFSEIIKDLRANKLSNEQPVSKVCPRYPSRH